MPSRLCFLLCCVLKDFAFSCAIGAIVGGARVEFQRWQRRCMVTWPAECRGAAPVWGIVWRCAVWDVSAHVCWPNTMIPHHMLVLVWRTMESRKDAAAACFAVAQTAVIGLTLRSFCRPQPL
jgi:hypothetical protein